MEDGQVLANVHYPDHSWSTDFYSDSAAWALLSLNHAISATHIDAGGYATFVEVVEGQKIWFIGGNDEGVFPTRDIPTGAGFDESFTNWYPVVLNKGDQL